jgi:3-methyladenine DNA glycosylase AlkD
VASPERCQRLGFIASATGEVAERLDTNAASINSTPQHAAPLQAVVGGRTIGSVEVEGVARAIDRELRGLGTGGRAQHEKAYLKSELNHYGVAVPAVRAVAKRCVSRHPSLTGDELVALVDLLWMSRVHEQRMICVELLESYRDRLAPADVALLERLVRDARTWALVDGLAASVVGYLVDNHPELGRTLDRWIGDDDLWIRRSALLALLVPLRRGDGDFERFSRYADAMLDDKEFFIRKAIGWVLRDTAKNRPELVYRWLLPRAARASGVTIREAVKPLSTQQRAAVLASR